jgi:hypothetical protein
MLKSMKQTGGLGMPSAEIAVQIINEVSTLDPYAVWPADEDSVRRSWRR